MNSTLSAISDFTGSSDESTAIANDVRSNAIAACSDPNAAQTDWDDLGSQRPPEAILIRRGRM